MGWPPLQRHLQMCEGLCRFAWVLVSRDIEFSELADTYYLYDKAVVSKTLCNLIFNACKNSMLTSTCADHGWAVHGKSDPPPQKWDRATLSELLVNVPYLRAKIEEVEDLLLGIERPLWSLPATEAILWTIYFNCVGLLPPYVADGWYDRSKHLSTILKSLDVPLSCCRWMEMSMLKGYGKHEFDLDAVAEKFCRGNGNLTEASLSRIYDAFRSVAGRPVYTGLRYDDYLKSGLWATSGSAGGLKERWIIDGVARERRLKKNMILDWYSPDVVTRKVMEMKQLRCVLAMKNEVGKARPVVSADPWSYVPMAWVMERVKPWLKSIPGFFVYVEGDDLVNLLTSTGKKLACRGDDIIVTLSDGRIFSFDFMEYDHQIPVWFVSKLWMDLTVDMDSTIPERLLVDKVTQLLSNIVLHWDVDGEWRERQMTGSLASGLRLTTYVGTVVSLGLGVLLSRTADPWPLVGELNVMYSRSKCYLRSGGEFLRNYFGADGVSAYPTRSVVAMLQHKPWLDAELGRAQAVAKARFVTFQRLGHVPPHHWPLPNEYGCPKLYGGLGINRFGWDYCKVDLDEESIRGVPLRGRMAQLETRGLPDDIYTMAVAAKQVRSTYCRVRRRILSGGTVLEKSNLSLWQYPLYYDELKLEYWQQRVSFYEALRIVSPELAWFVSEHKKWGRRQAMAVAKGGPEKAMCNTLFLPAVCVKMPDSYPGRLPGSLRLWYRAHIDQLSELGVRTLRMAS